MPGQYLKLGHNDKIGCTIRKIQENEIVIEWDT